MRRGTERHPSGRRCLAWLLFVLALTPALGSERQAAPDARPQSPPVFRAEVGAIDVDVFVTDQQGRFVRDLTKDDFEIVEDGQAQTVVTFSFVDLPFDETPVTAARVTGPEPDVITNDQPQGRTYVVLMDAPSTARPGGARDSVAYNEYARRFARQFIDEAVMPGDVVAVVHPQGTSTDSQGFTRSRERINASVDRYGRGLSGDAVEMMGPEMVTRNLNTYSAIEEVSTRLGAMGGRRKAIIWVGGQFAFDPNQVPCPSPDPYLLCAVSRSAGNLLAAYRDAIGAATRNNVAIYPVDPSGLTITLGAQELQRTSALRMVAEDTGGRAVVGTNNLTPRYQEIVRDNSVYYVLGYTPATVRRDGKFHDITVRVKRPGLKVRARKGYIAPRGDAPSAPPPALPDGVSVAARGALRMPIDVRGLAIDLFTAPYRGNDAGTSVVVGGRISGGLRLGASDTIALSYQVFTLDGKVHTGAYKVFTLNLREQSRDTTEKVGLRFVERITLPKGRYELRLVADQPGGSLGSIVTTIDVPQFDERLSISGVTLAAASTSAHMTLYEDAALREALGMTPTPMRRFPPGDVVAAFVEVYSNDSRAIDEDLAVSGIVTTRAGEEVALEPASRTATAVAQPGRWGYTIELPLVGFDPGDYVLTVEAAFRGQESERVRRQIPFAVEAER